MSEIQDFVYFSYFSEGETEAGGKNKNNGLALSREGCNKNIFSINGGRKGEIKCLSQS